MAFPTGRNIITFTYTIQYPYNTFFRSGLFPLFPHICCPHYPHAFSTQLRRAFAGGCGQHVQNNRITRPEKTLIRDVGCIVYKLIRPRFCRGRLGCVVVRTLLNRSYAFHPFLLILHFSVFTHFFRHWCSDEFFRQCFLCLY